MKRAAHARFVGVGITRKPIVDKHKQWGKALTQKEIIERQLNGEPIPSGEGYSSDLTNEMTERKPI